MKFHNLFQPIKIGGLEIKNRVSMTAINNKDQSDRNRGLINQRVVDYFVERARGGTGLIVTGVFKVENEIERLINLDDQTYRWPQASMNNIAEYAEMASQIHSFGGRVFMQLSAGAGRVMNEDIIRSGVQPVSSSANEAFFAPEVICRPLQTDEVERIVKAFADTAEYVAAAGIDGIEVHGHEGYLLDQFSSALWNRRTDKYGGSLENRLRFAIEILQAIKERVGQDYPVIYRMGIRHFIRGHLEGALHVTDEEIGRDVDETIQIAKILEDAGYDGISLDNGTYEGMAWAHPPIFQAEGFAVDMGAKVKEAVSMPVIIAGRIRNPEMAEQIIAEGKADMVGLGRALLADAYWAEKAARGRAADIRPCIACYDGCMRRPNEMGMTLGCSVNPAAGRETLAPVLPTIEPKRIAVVGGGPAGMECALVASRRGHDVTLFERTDKLGGRLMEAGIPDFKDDLNDLLDWYKEQIENNGVKVEYGVDVDLEFLKDQTFDTLVFAVGADPLSAPIPGIDKPFVFRPSDLLMGGQEAGERVIVTGGGLDGSETALWLAQQGKQVTVLEMESELATDAWLTSRDMLLRLMEYHGVEILPNTRLVEVTDGGVIVDGGGNGPRELPCDTLILALGMQPRTDLYGSASREYPDVYAIGDCKTPRNVHDAIWEGWNLARNL